MLVIILVKIFAFNFAHRYLRNKLTGSKAAEFHGAVTLVFFAWASIFVFLLSLMRRVQLVFLVLSRENLLWLGRRI